MQQYSTFFPPDHNTMNCLCNTFITSYFLFFLVFAWFFPLTVYPHPLCPFLALSFSFIPSLITSPSPLRSGPVRPSPGLQLSRPLLLRVLFQRLKQSQTVSGVFHTKGQRKWGEACRVCVMWQNSGRSPSALFTNCQHTLWMSFPLSSFCL